MAEFPCQVCGFQNQELSTFCNNCGSDITIRCFVCANQVNSTDTVCGNCDFDLRQTRYMRSITPDMVPPKVAARVLQRLGTYQDAHSLWNDVELLGEDDTGRELAQRVLSHRDTLGAHVMSLDTIATVEGISPARFTELIIALGVDTIPYVPRLSQGDTQPAHPRDSASSTELEFTYEILNPALPPHTGIIVARYCTRCASFAPGYNEERKSWERR